MHSYNIDNNERKNSYFLLAVFSILSAWLLKCIFQDLPWWIDAPSVFGFYGIYFKIFNEYAWKLKILHKIGLIQTPDVNGRWKGKLQSSFDNHEKEHDISVEINQKWTEMIIIFKTDNSVSKSMTASLLTMNPSGKMFSYQYANEPKSSATETMQIHRGTAWFKLSNDLMSFEGEYYSGRGRTNHGSMNLQKVQ